MDSESQTNLICKRSLSSETSRGKEGSASKLDLTLKSDHVFCVSWNGDLFFLTSNLIVPYCNICIFPPLLSLFTSGKSLSLSLCMFLVGNFRQQEDFSSLLFSSLNNQALSLSSCILASLSALYWTLPNISISVFYYRVQKWQKYWTWSLRRSEWQELWA